MEKQNPTKKEIKNNITKDENTFDAVKDNYAKRTDELDHFAKRLTNAYGDLNTELLYGSLNVLQHCLDLEEKHSQDFPLWYPSQLATNLVKQNTEAWIQAVQNVDTMYVESLKNIKNNVRAFNKNSNLFIQSVDRFYDFYKIPQ